MASGVWRRMAGFLGTAGLVGLWCVPAMGQVTPTVTLAKSGMEEPPVEEKIGRLERLVEAQQAKIESLRDRADAVEGGSNGTVRAAEVRKVVRELLADSDFRESLYPDVQQVGYKKGFYIRSSDEKFLLIITAYTRWRWTGQNRQTDDPRQQGRQKRDDINGFEVEDMYLTFRGHIHTPDLTYNITVEGDTDIAHDWRTYYAWINYKLAEEAQLTAGLMKAPFGRQETNSKSRLQFVDRSMANEMFNLDRVIAAGVHGVLAERLRYILAVANGIANRHDSPSQDELDTNFAYMGRLVAQIMGKQIKAENDLAYSKDPQMEAGLSFVYNDDNGDDDTHAAYSIPDRIRRGRGIGGNARADLTGTDLLQFGADVALRYRGFSLTAEYWLRTIDGDSEYSDWELLTSRSDSRHQQGGYVQAGYFIVPKKVEAAARLGGVWDNDGDNVWEYAFGLNYYPWGSYNVALQTDFTRIAEAPSSSSSANWSQNDELSMVRVQLQLKF